MRGVPSCSRGRDVLLASFRGTGCRGGLCGLEPTMVPGATGRRRPAHGSCYGVSGRNGVRSSTLSRTEAGRSHRLAPPSAQIFEASLVVVLYRVCRCDVKSCLMCGSTPSCARSSLRRNGSAGELGCRRGNDRAVGVLGKSGSRAVRRSSVNGIREPWGHVTFGGSHERRACVHSPCSPGWVRLA